MPRFKVIIHRPDDTEEDVSCNTVEALGALIVSMSISQLEVYDALHNRYFLVEISGPALMRGAQ